jgi:hypothetical protein
MWKDVVLDVFKTQPTIYVEGLWKCIINKKITNVVDEILVRKLQNVMQEYEILSRDAHGERNNVRRW